MELLIITPFKNEAATIEQTLQSICRQTMKPCQWILIDDGSTDESPEIVKEYEALYPFIYYHRRNQQENRATGANIVHLFNLGLHLANAQGTYWDVVLKLDADLVIDNKDYLEFITKKFESNSRLGIASGATYIEVNGKRKTESKHRWHTQGPNKFYRKECLHAMNGLRPFKGWDGIDDILARNNGFVTEKFFEQPVLHLYPTQSRNAEGGVIKGIVREAEGYQNRNYPVYMFVLKAITLLKKKGIYSSLYFLFYGIKIKLIRKPLVNDEESRIIRRFLLSRLSGKITFD